MAPVTTSGGGRMRNFTVSDMQSARGGAPASAPAARPRPRKAAAPPPPPEPVLSEGTAPDPVINETP